jgi:hypothetical protein
MSKSKPRNPPAAVINKAVKAVEDKVVSQVVITIGVVTITVAEQQSAQPAESSGEWKVP